MKAIHKRLIKIEERIERRDAPRISELIRTRYATMRAAQGLPPLVPQKDTRGLSIAEILRQRRARTSQSCELGSEAKALATLPIMLRILCAVLRPSIFVERTGLQAGALRIEWVELSRTAIYGD